MTGTGAGTGDFLCGSLKSATPGTIRRGGIAGDGGITHTTIHTTGITGGIGGDGTTRGGTITMWGIGTVITTDFMTATTMAMTMVIGAGTTLHGGRAGGIEVIEVVVPLHPHPAMTDPRITDHVAPKPCLPLQGDPRLHRA